METGLHSQLILMLHKAAATKLLFVVLNSYHQMSKNEKGALQKMMKKRIKVKSNKIIRIINAHFITLKAIF